MSQEIVTRVIQLTMQKAAKVVALKAEKHVPDMEKKRLAEVEIVFAQVQKGIKKVVVNKADQSQAFFK